jgi:glycosyltransferase involved in cell wall biosynthesis
VKVLYSFPHKIGADRICYIASQQVTGLTQAGVQVVAMPAAVTQPVPAETVPTLARGKFRIPFKLIGSRRAFRLHDHIISSRLEKLGDEIDVVHVWPSGALETIQTARRLGIPTVLERPNAHTRFAYDVVRDECKRIHVELPPGDEYEYRNDILELEEKEFDLADYLLCPSDFTAKTFRDRGFPAEKLIRHTYGYDENRFVPDMTPRDQFTVLFVGVASVRKGLHLALQAWKNSPAIRNGKFRIAGTIAPDYARHLREILEHPSVEALGHRRDIPELMRKADVLVLPVSKRVLDLFAPKQSAAAVYRWCLRRALISANICRMRWSIPSGILRHLPST